jgi:hypothetical protein
MDFSPGSLQDGLFLGALLFPLLIGRMDDFVWEKSLFFQEFSPNFGHCEGREFGDWGPESGRAKKRSAISLQLSAFSTQPFRLGGCCWVLLLMPDS